MSQQYQKQKKKWFDEGYNQALKDFSRVIKIIKKTEKKITKRGWGRFYG